jgi:phosphoglycolate phosphatase
MMRSADWCISKALFMFLSPVPSQVMQPHIQAELLVFDWDGTLFDSTAIIARCIQLAVRDVGGHEPSFEQASHVIGLGLLHALRLAAPDVQPEQYPELARRYGHHYDLHADDLSLFPGTLEMLADLQGRGYRLAIATGKSRKGLDHILERLPVEGLFVASRTADQTKGKPDPAMLLELMEECRVSAHHTLMVGDTSHDLQMALNAGCRSIGVSYGAHPAAQLEAFNPLFVAHSTQALHQGLLTHAGLSHEQN